MRTGPPRTCEVDTEAAGLDIQEVEKSLTTDTLQTPKALTSVNTSSKGEGARSGS